jgi:hypothetical protein
VSSDSTNKAIEYTITAIFSKVWDNHVARKYKLVKKNAELMNMECSIRYKGLVYSYEVASPYRKKPTYTPAHFSMIEKFDSFIADTYQANYLEKSFTNYLKAGYRNFDRMAQQVTGFQSWLEPYLPTKECSYLFNTPESNHLAELFADTIQLTKEQIVRNMLE